LPESTTVAYPGMTKFETRPTTTAEKTFVGLGRVASDAAEIPKRVVGAATGQADGDTFLKRMADPESGLLRSARQALATGDDNMAVKILGGIGLGAIEDPLSYLAGIIKSVQVLKANSQAFPNATKGWR